MARILFVDDIESITKFWKEALDHEFEGKIQIETCGDIDCLNKKIKTHYDIVFMDWLMGDDRTGFTVSKIVNDMIYGSAYLITGYFDLPEVQKWASDNSIKVIPKPVTYSYLRDFIKQNIKIETLL